MKTYLARLAIVLPLFFFGCQKVETFTDDKGYKWICDQDAIPAEKITYHKQKDNDMFLVCGDLIHAIGCTRRADGTADIFIPAKYPFPDSKGKLWTEQEVLVHEQTHARGCRHPDPLASGTGADTPTVRK